MKNLQFVIASYAAAAIGLVGLLIWLLADRFRQLSSLQQLEKARKAHRQTDKNRMPRDTI